MSATVSGPRLRAARQAAGLRLEKVAVEIGRSYNTVRQYESGVQRPPSNVLVALAELYGVSVEDLCSAGPKRPMRKPTRDESHAAARVLAGIHQRRAGEGSARA
jgi:transcriptional regulator with XRE-family HTH domain